MINIENIKEKKDIKELLYFGILNIDKPAEWTSFDVVNYVRKKLELKKCGHFGTLDPNVTGVLPICLENACKIQEYFMHRNKIYIGKMKIHKKITRKKLEEEMKSFIGKINQLPPRKSSVKRQIRQREIIVFELISFNDKKNEAEFKAEVEAGTYIRKLVHDLGEKIGGAHMSELRRIKAGLFSCEDKEFSNIEKFDKAVEQYKKGYDKLLRDMIIPAEIITKLLDFVEVKDEAVKKLKNGSPIFTEMLIDKEKAIKIINKDEAFAVVSGDRIIEIAKKTNQFENKDIIAKPESVM